MQTLIIMLNFSFLFFFSYAIFYKAYLCKNSKGKYHDHLIRDFTHSKDDLINTCLEVNNGLTYYEELLKNYKYDTNCLKYKYIGNYVLEKYQMNEFNCYEKIQKALCKLNYINKENVVVDVKNNSEEKKEKKGYHLWENNLNSKFSKCHNIKKFFVHLINRCINNHEEDSLVHCASFDYQKRIILDGDIFCKSSFEQIKVEQNFNKNSIYGESYKNYITKTISFQNDDFNDCLNMVNIFNNCSVVQNKLFNKTLDICLLEKNTQFCNIQLEKVNDQNYIYTCSDIILPYLLSFNMHENNKTTYEFDDDNKYITKQKDEENQSFTNKERCHDIYNYLKILKDNKKKVLQEKKVLEQHVKNINIINKLYKILHNILQILKNETDKYNIDIKEFFEIMENIKSNKFIKKQYIILILNKINEEIIRSYQIMLHFPHPILNNNTINENISLVNYIKEHVNNFIKLYKDIASNAKLINEYIKKNDQNNNTLNDNINLNKNISNVDNMYHTDNKKNFNNLHNMNQINNDFNTNHTNNILKDKNVNEINIDELQKFKQIYHNINKLIQKYTKQTNNSIFNLPVPSVQDFKRDINNHNTLIDLYTDQISLLIKNNILS